MSLKWRIAVGYTVLLIVAITAMSGIIVWRFPAILYEQAQTSVNATMRAIVQFARQPTTPFSRRRFAARHAAISRSIAQISRRGTRRTATFRSIRDGYPVAKTANWAS